MKKIVIGLALSSGLLGCQKDKSASGNLSASDFAVTNQKTASVPLAGADNVAVTLKKVSDSRCPNGAQCIWAGYVQTTIEVKTAADAVQTVDLCLAQCGVGTPWHYRDSTTVLINKQPYWLCLTAVNPYPSVKNFSTEAQTAALRLVPQ
ncbi:hypothetical protein [Hymenobacter sp. GOD-10R]|uniref:hypothetical protein n=1 Tax=Hymenobacter sp. GOD-10R TaxID=3093922 RepID=UPI002D775612|nr:hypothetical protein [Hymenobacter sp. GOD-10R]WRQ29336.1 hypothetical protein SD425_03545 [Hymenobacter sp. GOD-10R]